MDPEALKSNPENDPLRQIATAIVALPRDVDPAVFREGVAALHRYLQRRFLPALSLTEVEDLAVDSVTRLYEASMRGLIDEAGNPTGYLVKMAKMAALAKIRQRRQGQSATSVLDYVLSDDEAAARLDQVATADAVRRCMAAAWDAQDATAVRVAAYLLDEIQRTGATPSNRQAADTLHLSHTGVAKALVRLRHYLAEAE